MAYRLVRNVPSGTLGGVRDRSVPEPPFVPPLYSKQMRKKMSVDRFIVGGTRLGCRTIHPAPPKISTSMACQISSIHCWHSRERPQKSRCWPCFLSVLTRIFEFSIEKYSLRPGRSKFLSLLPGWGGGRALSYKHRLAIYAAQYGSDK